MDQSVEGKTHGLLSYWDKPVGPPSWPVPEYPRGGLVTIGEHYLENRAKIVYVDGMDLARARREVRRFSLPERW